LHRPPRAARIFGLAGAAFSAVAVEMWGFGRTAAYTPRWRVVSFAARVPRCGFTVSDLNEFWTFKFT
jgi:hypothetical protein